MYINTDIYNLVHLAYSLKTITQYSLWHLHI